MSGIYYQDSDSGSYEAITEITYLKISRNVEAEISGLRNSMLLWNLAGSATFRGWSLVQNFKEVHRFQYVISQLRDFVRTPYFFRKRFTDSQLLCHEILSPVTDATGFTLCVYKIDRGSVAFREYTTCNEYHETSNIRRTLVGIKIVGHSDVLGASPAGAPATSSFATYHLASINCIKTASSRDEKHLSFDDIWCVLY